MQPPNNNPAPPQPNHGPAPPQPAVMGSVAQPYHQSYTQPQMVGQPVIMQQMPGGIVMGGGYPQTSAQTALILSIVSIFLGGGAICMAIPALIIANGALAITNQMPGHPDAGTAKTAQVISWIMIGLTLLVIGFFVLFFIGAAASSGY